MVNRKVSLALTSLLVQDHIDRPSPRLVAELQCGFDVIHSKLDGVADRGFRNTCTNLSNVAATLDSSRLPESRCLPNDLLFSFIELFKTSPSMHMCTYSP